MTEGTTHGTALEEGYETDAWTIDGAKRLETMKTSEHAFKGKLKEDLTEKLKKELKKKLKEKLKETNV